jgi:hypothetical protein
MMPGFLCLYTPSVLSLSRPSRGIFVSQPRPVERSKSITWMSQLSQPADLWSALNSFHVPGVDWPQLVSMSPSSEEL